MTRYYCTPSSSLRITALLGQAMDRALRPYTAGELAGITGVPVQVVKSFLVRNASRGVLSVRMVARPDLSSHGKTYREYWVGHTDIHGTFGRGDMMTRKQTRELADGRRPMQWRGEQATVWSIDEANVLAVRRGNTVLTIGKAERIYPTKKGAAIFMADGSRLEFAAKDKKEREE